MQLKMICNSEKETFELVTHLARLATPGDVFLLEGELGAGKTTFTKGLAKGLGIDRVIKSPTYTLIREYSEGRLPLYHMDLYRLDEEEAEELGLDEYFEGEGVTVVEWASLAPEEMPTNFLEIKIARTGVSSSSRQFIFIPTGTHYEKLVSELSKHTKNQP